MWSKTWQTVDKECGVYVPPAVLVLNLGYLVDPAGAFRRAERYVANACALGGQWLSWNPMTEEVEVFELRREHKEIMGDKWAVYSKEHATGEHDRRHADNDKGDQQKTQRGRVATRKPNTDIEDKTKRSLGRPDKSPNAADSIRRAGDLEKLYLHATAWEACLVDTVESSQPTMPWHWAKNNENVGQLKLAQQTLQDKLSEDDKRLILTDFRELRNTISEQDFEMQVGNFLGLEPLVQKVIKQCKRLQSMHTKYLESE